MSALDELMAKYDAGLNDLPILFFPDEGEQSAAGLDLALFLLWAYSRGQLEEGLSSRLSKSAIHAGSTFADMVRIARACLDDGVRPSNFNDQGRPFALKSLRPGWEYRYHLDLDALFPDEATYADIPELPASIERVFSVLDMRRQQFKDAAT